ncbi:MAG: hypothetical protein J5825_09395 [Lachnospiraceae bacterium]|nr:hypothetical protein [Lachnospiraceae bacterium]
MKKYTYQKFLLQCDYDSVELKDFPVYSDPFDLVLNVGRDYNLFDVGKKYVRKISLNELDDAIDTIEDWTGFIKTVDEYDELIIYNDVPFSSNMIISAYRTATLKAYLFRIQSDCKKVKVYFNDFDTYHNS